VPLAAGIIIGIGNVTLNFTDTFSLTGIALGSIVAVVAWHLARALAPAEMKLALSREGTHPAAASSLGHHTAAGDDASDPSSVDEVTGDEARLRAESHRRDDRPGAPGR
jgi:hypothetical protein